MNNQGKLTNHGANLISIKSLKSFVDISDIEFSDLISKCLAQSEVVYFRGERANYDSNEIMASLEMYSEFVLFPNNNKSSILCEIPQGILSISRNGFKQIWDHYEYPALFFVSKDMPKSVVTEVLMNSRCYEVAVDAIGKCLVVYTGVENDVIWVRKGDGIAFPDFKY